MLRGCHSIVISKHSQQGHIAWQSDNTKNLLHYAKQLQVSSIYFSCSDFTLFFFNCALHLHIHVFCYFDKHMCQLLRSWSNYIQLSTLSACAYFYIYLLLLYVKNFRVHVLKSRLIYQPHRSREYDKMYRSGCWIVYLLFTHSTTPLESHKLHILTIVVSKVIICYFNYYHLASLYFLIQKSII
jgi:hypothetical protein